MGAMYKIFQYARCLAVVAVLCQGVAWAETVVGTQSKSETTNIKIEDPLLIFSKKENDHELLLEVYQKGKLIQQNISQGNFFALRAKKSGFCEYKIFSINGVEKKLLSYGQIKIDPSGTRKISSVDSAVAENSSIVPEQSAGNYVLHFETFTSRIWTNPRVTTSQPPIKSAFIAIAVAGRWNKSIGELMLQTKVASFNSPAEASKQKSLEGRYKYILQGESVGFDNPSNGEVQTAFITGIEIFRDNKSIQTPRYEMLKIGVEARGSLYRSIALQAEGTAGRTISNSSHKLAYGVSLLLPLSHRYKGQLGYRANFLTMTTASSSPVGATLPYRQSTEDFFLGISSTF